MGIPLSKLIPVIYISKSSRNPGPWDKNGVHWDKVKPVLLFLRNGLKGAFRTGTIQTYGIG
jgi:hypothetical protein